MCDYFDIYMKYGEKRTQFLHTLNMHYQINRKLKVIHFQKGCTLYYSTI